MGADRVRDVADARRPRGRPARGRSKGSGAGLDTLHAKNAIAELAESMTQRLCRVIGGGSFHRASPFGAAFEDVRALGFLRPPWGLAYDQLWQRTRDAM